ncbi:MAG: Lrp/AsnC family transcriptional regulator [Candidatus Sumerlaeaceae bacterium]
MNQKILHLLRENARLTNEQIARRVGLPVERVATAIEDLEEQKAIVAYKAIINPEFVSEEAVKAIIEVKVTPKRGHGFDEIARRIGGFPEVQSLYLMSGGTDFLVFMEARSIKDIARFVTEKLATQEDVQSTTSHFVLKHYKEEGVVLHDEGPTCRLAVTP